MSQADLYRSGMALSQEIAALQRLRNAIKAERGAKNITGEVSHWRTHGLKVHIPRATALRLLSSEIASKQAELAEVIKGIK